MNPNQTRDPVHMDPDGSWWFYDETWAARFGPYASPEEARTNLTAYTEWLNSQAQPEKAAAPEQTELDLAVAEYIRIRDEKAAVANRHKQELAELTSQLDKADAYLLSKLQSMGVESFKAGGATVFYATELRASIGDKGALMNHIRATGEVEILQSRVSSTVLREWMDRNNGTTPPGVSASFERVVRVRKN